jgi:hypothetical protein
MHLRALVSRPSWLPDTTALVVRLITLRHALAVRTCTCWICGADGKRAAGLAQGRAGS